MFSAFKWVKNLFRDFGISEEKTFFVAMFNAQHFLMFAETKHFFRALAMTFWPWPIFGIFLAKKTPKMALGPKNLGAAQFFFCPSSCWYCRAFHIEIYHIYLHYPNSQRCVLLAPRAFILLILKQTVLG